MRQPASPAILTGVWMVLAAIALWWPGRLSGPLDGAPLDRVAEVLLLGLAFPLLCWFHPAFLRDRRVQVFIVALIAWKAGTTALLVQDGWCVRMLPARPYVRDGIGAPHSWDVRADWRSADPACTAVMTRGYSQFEEFPIWFFNLPAATGHLPEPEDVPPVATTNMIVRGWMTTSQPGALSVRTNPSLAAAVAVDGQGPAGPDGIGVPPGSHYVDIDLTLTGDKWKVEPLWNNEDLFSRVTATVAPPSTFDRLVRPWASWAAGILTAALLAVWIGTALARVFDPWLFAWTVGAGVLLALVGKFVPETRWHYVMAAFAAAAFLPVRDQVKNTRGAFLLFGVPWLVLVVVMAAVEIGRTAFYTPGNDWWQFQRYAYRIFLQGYWLEGGEQTFWFQPLYRWIAGALHLLFSDSSIGEELWDGVGVLVMVLFSFHVVRLVAGYRWGILAGALTLTCYMAGPGFIFVGRGLSEISSAAFIYGAAVLAHRSRNGSWLLALAAGICATLGAWTRLNNLPMALAVLVFAWPVDEPVRTLWRPREWGQRVSKPALVLVPAALAVGFMLFAARTWYYTGVFSAAHGTALDATRGTARRVWQPEMSIGEGLSAMFDSVMMVVTTTDPPHVHNGAIPLMAGVGVAVLALTGVGWLGRLPLGLVLFCLSSVAGSLVSRGTAYPGRFSIHIIGAATAVLACALSSAASWLMGWWKQRSRQTTPSAA